MHPEESSQGIFYIQKRFWDLFIIAGEINYEELYPESIKSARRYSELNGTMLLSIFKRKNMIEDVNMSTPTLYLKNEKSELWEKLTL
nr:8144_t:CDS:2 [Entrophospora candida]